MADEREEIARLTSRIDEERAKAASYPLGDPMCSRHGGIRDGLKEALEIILDADRAQGPGEAVALTSVLANACYLMSEPHLSGHRVILGFDTLDGATAAHVALSMAIIAATPTREGDDLTPEGRAALDKASA